MTNSNVTILDEEKGVFTGYASVFNVVDNHGDIIKKGSFFNLNSKKIRLLWNHNPNKPIGKILSIKEDDWGLKVTGKINLKLSMGMDAYNLLMDNNIDGLSIGFKEIDTVPFGDGNRLLKKIKLLEISIVLFPSNELSVVSSIKSSDNVSKLLASLDKAINIIRSFNN